MTTSGAVARLERRQRHGVDHVVAPRRAHESVVPREGQRGPRQARPVERKPERVERVRRAACRPAGRELDPRPFVLVQLRDPLQEPARVGADPARGGPAQLFGEDENPRCPARRADAHRPAVAPAVAAPTASR